jgi:DNA-binding NarL/FixJ family response regulator
LREEAMRSTTSPSPLRILIAEAHPIVALGLTDLLHKIGYVLVGSVASGQEAITAAGEHQPDLLLMDVKLRGGMDGITAAVEIYTRLGIRSVFLAEHVDAMVRARAAEAAPVAVLDKTSSMSAIADALRAAPLQLTH